MTQAVAAFENSKILGSLLAGETLTANKFAKVHGGENVKFADAQERCDGVIMYDAISGDPELAPLLRVVTPTLQLGGIAGHMESGHTRSVLAQGLVAPEINRLMQWNDYGMVSYAQPLALEGTAPHAAVIGTGVARKLQLCAALQVPHCTNASTNASTKASTKASTSAGARSPRRARRCGSALGPGTQPRCRAPAHPHRNAGGHRQGCPQCGQPAGHQGREPGHQDD